MCEERTICHTPTLGRKPTSIPTWKYQVAREAILQVIPTVEPGILAMDLPGLVSSIPSAEVREKLGSITWHTTTVKLNMETEGELYRAPKLKPQHFIRS